MAHRDTTKNTGFRWYAGVSRYVAHLFAERSVRTALAIAIVSVVMRFAESIHPSAFDWIVEAALALYAVRVLLVRP